MRTTKRQKFRSPGKTCTKVVFLVPLDRVSLGVDLLVERCL
jgi:hypothetical protein